MTSREALSIGLASRDREIAGCGVTMPALANRKQAAALLGIGLSQVQLLLNAGQLPSVRLGPQTVRIPVAAIEAFIARGGVKG